MAPDDRNNGTVQILLFLILVLQAVQTMPDMHFHWSRGL